MSPHEENSVSDKSSIEESPARRLTNKTRTNVIHKNLNQGFILKSQKQNMYNKSI